MNKMYRIIYKGTIQKINVPHFTINECNVLRKNK